TDTGHNIIDLNLHYIDNPQELAEYLESQVGVVEHGLFINIADVVIIGGEQIVTHNRRQ
ncbi:ribose-5-phosphate isomerase A, partial [Leuconostoc suionicum]